MTENIDAIVIMSAIVPFIVQALKYVLSRFKKEVKGQTLVLIVCVALGTLYAAVVSFAPEQMLITLAEVAGISFVTSQGLYKLYSGVDSSLDK